MGPTHVPGCSQLHLMVNVECVIIRGYDAINLMLEPVGIDEH